MSIYNRIAGLNNEAKISPHHLTAVLSEEALGALTTNQALAAFVPALTAAETTEVAAITTRLTAALLTRSVLHDVLILVEQQVAPYNTEAGAKARLGI